MTMGEESISELSVKDLLNRFNELIKNNDFKTAKPILDILQVRAKNGEISYQDLDECIRAFDAWRNVVDQLDKDIKSQLLVHATSIENINGWSRDTNILLDTLKKADLRTGADEIYQAHHLEYEKLKERAEQHQIYRDCQQRVENYWAESNEDGMPVDTALRILSEARSLVERTIASYPGTPGLEKLLEDARSQYEHRSVEGEMMTSGVLLGEHEKSFEHIEKTPINNNITVYDEKGREIVERRYTREEALDHVRGLVRKDAAEKLNVYMQNARNKLNIDYDPLGAATELKQFEKFEKLQPQMGKEKIISDDLRKSLENLQNEVNKRTDILSQNEISIVTAIKATESGQNIVVFQTAWEIILGIAENKDAMSSQRITDSVKDFYDYISLYLGKQITQLGVEMASLRLSHAENIAKSAVDVFDPIIKNPSLSLLKTQDTLIEATNKFATLNEKLSEVQKAQGIALIISEKVDEAKVLVGSNLEAAHRIIKDLEGKYLQDDEPNSLYHRLLLRGDYEGIRETIDLQLNADRVIVGLQSLMMSNSMLDVEKGLQQAQDNIDHATHGQKFIEIENKLKARKLYLEAERLFREKNAEGAKAKLIQLDRMVQDDITRVEAVQLLNDVGNALQQLEELDNISQDLKKAVNKKDLEQMLILYDKLETFVEPQDINKRTELNTARTLLNKQLKQSLEEWFTGLSIEDNIQLSELERREEIFHLINNGVTSKKIEELINLLKLSQQARSEASAGSYNTAISLWHNIESLVTTVKARNYANLQRQELQYQGIFNSGTDVLQNIRQGLSIVDRATLETRIKDVKDAVNKFSVEFGRDATNDLARKLRELQIQILMRWGESQTEPVTVLQIIQDVDQITKEYNKLYGDRRDVQLVTNVPIALSVAELMVKFQSDLTIDNHDAVERFQTTYNDQITKSAQIDLFPTWKKWFDNHKWDLTQELRRQVNNKSNSQLTAWGDRLLYAGKLLVLDSKDAIAQSAIAQFVIEANKIEAEIHSVSDFINKAKNISSDSIDEIFSEQQKHLTDIHGYLNRLSQIKPLLGLLKTSAQDAQLVNQIHSSLNNSSNWHTQIDDQNTALNRFKELTDQFFIRFEQYYIKTTDWNDYLSYDGQKTNAQPNPLSQFWQAFSGQVDPVFKGHKVYSIMQQSATNLQKDYHKLAVALEKLLTLIDDNFFEEAIKSYAELNREMEKLREDSDDKEDHLYTQLTIKGYSEVLGWKSLSTWLKERQAEIEFLGRWVCAKDYVSYQAYKDRDRLENKENDLQASITTLLRYGAFRYAREKLNIDSSVNDSVDILYELQHPISYHLFRDRSSKQSGDDPRKYRVIGNDVDDRYKQAKSQVVSNRAKWIYDCVLGRELPFYQANKKQIETLHKHINEAEEEWKYLLDQLAQAIAKKDRDMSRKNLDFLKEKFNKHPWLPKIEEQFRGSFLSE